MAAASGDQVLGSREKNASPRTRWLGRLYSTRNFDPSRSPSGSDGGGDVFVNRAVIAMVGAAQGTASSKRVRVDRSSASRVARGTLTKR